MNITELINSGEGKTIEFKELMPSSESIAKTIVAFANMFGGRLLIGVSNDGTIKGLPDANPTEYSDRISNIIHDMIHPMVIPDIYAWSVGNTSIIIIEVHSSPLKPHFLKKYGKESGTFARIGATNKKADREFILELERQSRNITFDEDLCYDFNLEGFHFDKFQNLLSSALNREITLGDLTNLKLMKKQNNTLYLSNAVQIITGEMEHASIQCARFKGNSVSVFLDRKELRGSIFEQLENAMTFLLSHINLRSEIGSDHIRRVDTYEIPPAGLREAVINALVHRDYSMTGSDIKIAVFDDLIEITSPGCFPRGITADEILNGRSEIRNRILARIFKEAGLTEQWGHGVRSIMKLCDDYGLKRPEIKESGLFVQFIFHRTVAQNKKNRTIKSDDKNRTIKSDDKNRTNAILEYIRENGRITRAETMELLGLGKSRTSDVLAELEGNKMIRRIRAGRSTSYDLGQK